MMYKRITNLPNYFISEEGDIFAVNKNKMLKLSTSKIGYKVLDTRLNGKRKIFYVHRLVCETFFQNPQNKKCVNHKDGNKLNNSINNLEWVTHKENTKHGWETGLHKVTPNMIDHARKLGLQNGGKYSKKENIL